MRHETQQSAIENAADDHSHFVEDFEGKNCDDCAGWNTQDNRCECGNRRVCWTTIQDSGGWYTYAEAY